MCVSGGSADAASSVGCCFERRTPPERVCYKTYFQLMRTTYECQHSSREPLCASHAYPQMRIRSSRRVSSPSRLATASALPISDW